MPKLRRFRFFLVLAVSVFACVGSAQADVRVKEYQTILRSIGFLENKSDERANFGVVYNASDAASVSEMESFVSLISQKSKDFAVVKIDASNLSSYKGDLDYVFVSRGVPQSLYGDVGNYLNTHKTLGFSVDRNCLENKYCTIFVSYVSKVEIIVNKEFLEYSGHKFKSIFLMMVKVI
ncbi:MAG: hypothetical protein ACRBDI_04450 [Alphaproteobacteria bacterium]